MTTVGWISLGIVNIPVYMLLGWCIFRDWDDFIESVRFWLTPNIISLFRGEYMDDWWASLKLGIWISICGAVVFAQGELIEHMILGG